MEMARAFREQTEAIAKSVNDIRERGRVLQMAFTPEEGEAGCVSDWTFQLDVGYDHHGHGGGFRYTEPDQLLGELRTRMARHCWELLVDRIGLRNIMSVAKRKEFDEQLRKGELPEISEETIYDILCGLCGQAQDFAKGAALEVFDILRPRGHWGGQYKTNDDFRVGRKVILGWYVERGFSGNKFRVNYHHEAHVTAIDAIFHLLDGMGIMRENRGPLYNAISEAEGGRGETEYFRFRCFKNHNLHLEFRRLDLVRRLNLLATGEHVLGHDPEEA
jgi:hypothetical protein